MAERPLVVENEDPGEGMKPAGVFASWLAGDSRGVDRCQLHGCLARPCNPTQQIFEWTAARSFSHLCRSAFCEIPP